MVRKLTALFALVLSLGMVVMPAAAQDISTDDAEEFGLQSGYLRTYIADPSAATAVPVDLVGVMVAGFEFDSADSAESSFEDFSCGFAGGFMDVEEASDCDGLAELGYTVSDVDGIGDQAIEISGEADIDGPTPVSILSLQSENYLFMVIHMGVDEPGSGDAIANFLVNAEPSDAEVMLNEDGTSTGGFFDMVPQDGDAEIEGMISVLDIDLFAEDGVATPAS